MNEDIEDLCPQCGHLFHLHGTQEVRSDPSPYTRHGFMCFAWVVKGRNQPPKWCGCLYTKDEYE